MFGWHRGYRCAEETSRPAREQTATIVWEGFASLGVVPLLWNAYPFHPHRPGEPQSNRAPSAAELRTGAEFLRRLLAMFEIEQVVAVGNVAAATLGKLGVECARIRHPANGGKGDFLRGIAGLDLEYAGAPCELRIK
jgi:uracil-DNA glycosylase